MKVESKRKRERKGKKIKGFSNLNNNNNKRESLREKDVKTKIQTKMH